MPETTKKAPAKKAAAPATTTTQPVDHGSLAAALVAFQAEVPAVAKNHTARVPMKGGGSYSYTYADLADTSDAILPALTRHGLAFVCVPRQEQDGRYSLVGTLVHASGETMEGAAPLHGRSPQEVGSSLTYMRRYLMCAMTGVVADDDDDGQRAQAAEGRTQGTSTDEPSPEPERQEHPEPRPDQAILLDRLQGYGPADKGRLLKWYGTTGLGGPETLAPNQVAWVMQKLDEYDNQQAQATEGAEVNPPA